MGRRSVSRGGISGGERRDQASLGMESEGGFAGAGRGLLLGAGNAAKWLSERRAGGRGGKQSRAVQGRRRATGEASRDAIGTNRVTSINTEMISPLMIGEG